jgi:hypothetical protein
VFLTSGSCWPCWPWEGSSGVASRVAIKHN